MRSGQIINQLRTQANLTQEQLAEKLFVSRELVSKWENGHRQPDYQTVLKIAKLFDVPPDSIINRNNVFLSEIAEYLPNFSDELIIEKLTAFLATLSDRNRSVFLRRYYFLEEISDISSNYQIPEYLVRTILMRTRKKMKKYFKEENNAKK